MRLLFGGYRIIRLILQETPEEKFIKWLEKQPRNLSTESAEWENDHYVMVCVYGEPDEEDHLQTRRETIKVLVMPNKINTTEIEIVCNPTASIPQVFLKLIKERWPETRERIAAFIGGESIPPTAKNAPLEFPLIKGTPSQFATMARALGMRLFQAGKYTYAPFWTHLGDWLPQDANQVMVNIAGNNRGIIRASWAGASHTILSVEFQDATWEEIEPFWNILMQELERLHLIENDGHNKTDESKGKLTWPVKIPRQFEIVDAAVDKHLRELCARFAGYKREQTTPVSVIYRLHHRYIGVVETRKLDEQLTELSTTEPTIPHLIKMTPEEFEFNIQAWEKPSLTDEQKRQELREVITRAETDYEKTLSEYQGIIDTLLERLKQDRLLQDGDTAQTSQSAAGVLLDYKADNMRRLTVGYDVGSFKIYREFWKAVEEVEQFTENKSQFIGGEIILDFSRESEGLWLLTVQNSPESLRGQIELIPGQSPNETNINIYSAEQFGGIGQMMRWLAEELRKFAENRGLHYPPRSGTAQTTQLAASAIAANPWEKLAREMWDTERCVLPLPIETLKTAIIEQRHSTSLRAEVATETPTVASYYLRRGDDTRAEIIFSLVDASQTKCKFIPSSSEITPDSSTGRALIEFVAGTFWNANDSNERARETSQPKPDGAGQDEETGNLPPKHEREAIIAAVCKAQQKRSGLTPKWEDVLNGLSFPDYSTGDNKTLSVPTLRDRKMRPMLKNETALQEIRAAGIEEVFRALAGRKRKK